METNNWEQSEYSWETPSIPVSRDATHYTRIFTHSGPHRRVLADVFGVSEEDAKKAAKLMTAAPELLEVLQNALNDLRHLKKISPEFQYEPGLIKRLDVYESAIEKATK
jgi:hypothetical protein